MRSGLTRLTVRPLSVRVTGEIRTRDLFSSHWSALSTELQRHAGVNLLTLERERGGVILVWINTINVLSVILLSPSHGSASST